MKTDDGSVTWQRARCQHLYDAAMAARLWGDLKVMLDIALADIKATVELHLRMQVEDGEGQG